MKQETDLPDNLTLEFAVQDFILNFATLKNTLKLLLFALNEGSSELEWDNIASVTRLLEKYSMELGDELHGIENLLSRQKSKLI